jgi:phage shock protein E
MKKNIGDADRIIRVIFAAIIFVLYFAGVVKDTFGMILLALSGILVLTSVISFCPLYLPFGLSTIRKKKSSINLHINKNVMLKSIKNILGISPSVDYSALVKEGAVILDVRSKGEYSSGHIEGSINMSVDQLENNLNRLPDKNKTIITCCASGMRSASAKNILKANGYTNVHNGGAWTGLQNKI